MNQHIHRACTVNTNRSIHPCDNKAHPVYPNPPTSPTIPKFSNTPPHIIGRLYVLHSKQPNSTTNLHARIQLVQLLNFYITWPEPILSEAKRAGGRGLRERLLPCRTYNPMYTYTNVQHTKLKNSYVYSRKHFSTNAKITDKMCSDKIEHLYGLIAELNLVLL